MAPNYRRLVTQSSSLSGSSNGNNDNGAGANVNSSAATVAGGDSDSATGKYSSSASASDGPPVADSPTVVSTQSYQNKSIGPTGHKSQINSFAPNASVSYTHIAPSIAENHSAPAIQPMPQHSSLVAYAAGQAVVAGVGMSHHHQPIHPSTAAVAQHHFIPGVTSSSFVPTHAPIVSPFFKNAKQRRGKWTPEEEKYTSFLIKEFELGSLPDCENGSTLRSYISKKLHCAPMRISKKYAGKSIGKHVFLARSSGGPDMKERSEKMEKLRELEEAFHQSLIREGSGIPMNPTMPQSFMYNGLHSFGSNAFPQHQHSFAQGPLYQGLVPNGSGAMATPYSVTSTQPGQGSTAMQVAAWPVAGLPQTGVGHNASNLMTTTVHDHAKQLEQSFLNALNQAQKNENDAVNGQTSQNNPAGVSSSNADAQQVVTNEAAKEMPDILSGFDKVASHATKGTDSSGNQLPPVPLWPSECYVGPCSPTITSRSFDEMHKHLGSNIPSSKFQLSSNQGDGKKVVQGPATAALNKQQNNNFLNGKNRTEEEMRGMPQPALASMQNSGPGSGAMDSVAYGPVTADAYAMFAQQSAIAVSQHSAYCRSDAYQPSVVPRVAGTKRSSAHLGSDQGVHLQRNINASQPVPAMQGDARQVATIVDDSSTTCTLDEKKSSSKSCTSSVVNSANLKAHTKAMKAKARHVQQPEQDESSSSSSSDSSSLLQRHHHRLQKRQRISTTTTAYLPNADANIVSSSDRSGSELGTESESAIGSSHGSSAGSGSGSDNVSDNASDQSDTASEENSVTKRPVTNMDRGNSCNNGTQSQDLTRRELIGAHNALPQAKGPSSQ